MLKDKELKQKILKAMMSSMDDRVVENDLMPKTKMVIKAEGDNPKDLKKEVINKLQSIEMPEEDDDYMSEMPPALKKAIMKKLKK